jgi:hypothetical protein
MPVTWKYPGASDLVATRRSGSMRYAERVTYVQEFEGKLTAARTLAGLYYRGTIWQIAGFNGNFIVDDTSIVPDGQKGTVTINYTWLGSLPPDEWSVTPVEINPALEKNSVYAALTAADVKQARRNFNASSQEAADSVESAITAATNAALIQSLVTKLSRGQETFYMAGAKYQWTAFFNTLSGVTLRMGGYREAPGGPGTLPAGFIWLRMADELSWSNGLYKLTRCWIGAPSYASYWDTDLYGTTPQ